MMEQVIRILTVLDAALISDPSSSSTVTLSSSKCKVPAEVSIIILSNPGSTQDKVTVPETGAPSFDTTSTRRSE
jgi:hypothetical protein